MILHAPYFLCRFESMEYFAHHCQRSEEVIALWDVKTYRVHNKRFHGKLITHLNLTLR